MGGFDTDAEIGAQASSFFYFLLAWEKYAFKFLLVNYLLWKGKIKSK